MKRFLLRLRNFSIFVIVPIIILILLYIYFDPFKVLRNYNNYSSIVIPNRDFVSTKMFINNYNKYNYNSFIFGSSRTLAFRPSSWRRYLSVDSRPFMFDASGESIYGIYTKIKYIDSKNVDLDNVLIILCRDVTFEHSENHQGHLFIKHPATTGESTVKSQSVFLKAYFDPKFLFSFYAYKVIGKYKPFMSGILEDEILTYDSITNELNISYREEEILQNPSQYYLDRKSIFYERKGEQTDSVTRIGEKQLAMLKEIKMILEENKTNYKVIISPLYEQVKFSEHDFKTLKSIFDDHLYDFSGKNITTEPKSNYFETSHYRPIVGDSILYLLYNETPSN